MSAPAANPLFFAEISTAPRGGSCSSAPSSSSSSASTPAESTLADVPGLSRVSQAIPSASRSSFQALELASFMWASHRSGRGGGRGVRGGGLGIRAYGGAGVHAEIAHQRPMVREAHIRDAKVGHLDTLAHQDEVELDTRHTRGEGGEARSVGTAQASGAHEQINLVRTPEGVEVPRHDHRLGRLQNQVVERAQLVLALAELQRQVHQEHAHIRELQLDDQPLDAGVKVMETLAVHVRGRQEGVALLAHDRHELVDRVRAVLALKGRVVSELPGDVLGLVQHAGTNGAGVDLDQSDDVRLLRAQELGDAGQYLAVTAQVARARYRQVKGRTRTGRIANVVDEQSHLAGELQRRGFKGPRKGFYRAMARCAVPRCHSLCAAGDARAHAPSADWA